MWACPFGVKQMYRRWLQAEQPCADVLLLSGRKERQSERTARPEDESAFKANSNTPSSVGENCTSAAPEKFKLFINGTALQPHIQNSGPQFTRRSTFLIAAICCKTCAKLSQSLVKSGGKHLARPLSQTKRSKTPAFNCKDHSRQEVAAPPFP